jgi:hypothetical protein
MDGCFIQEGAEVEMLSKVLSFLVLFLVLEIVPVFKYGGNGASFPPVNIYWLGAEVHDGLEYGRQYELESVV